MNYIVFTILFIILYCNSIKCPNLLLNTNNLLKKILKNKNCRILILFFIIYNSYNNFLISLILSIIFILIMNTINEDDIKESFEQIKEYKNI